MVLSDQNRANMAGQNGTGVIGPKLTETGPIRPIPEQDWSDLDIYIYIYCWHSPYRYARADAVFAKRGQS